MSNISIYQENALTGGSTVTVTGIAPNSSAAYLSDSRLSFKYVTTGSETEIQVDQDPINVIVFTDLVMVDHNLAGSTFTLTSYTDSGRGSPTVEINAQEIPNEDPYIKNVGTLTNYANFDIDITVSGGATASIGEIMAAVKFTSPQRPGIGIQTIEVPRTTFILMPNGERQSVKHGGVVRIKNYTIGGLTIDQANEWVDIFTDNANLLVVLEDERGDTYPAMMNQELIIDDDSKILSIDLEFTEVKLN